MTGIENQYRIIASRAGWIDRSARGRIRFAGADAPSFLQGLLTNDVATLEPNRGVYAAYLTPIGRMITDMTVLNRGEGGFLGLVPERQGANLASRFDLLIFTEAVEVTDVTTEFAEFEVTGGAAAEVVAQAFETEIGMLESLADLEQTVCRGGFVLRDGASPFPAFRVFVAPNERNRVVAALDARGAVAMTEELATALRIEAGRGEWGHDLGEDVIPLEAGLLDRAISTSKGCYVGQEVVIRILHRGGGRVAKRLVTLAFDPALTEPPPVKAPISADDTVVGQLTSVAFWPPQSRLIALGYVRREAAEVGRQVRVGEAKAPAVITGFAR